MIKKESDWGVIKARRGIEGSKKRMGEVLVCSN
jgi:hypothetical protein